MRVFSISLIVLVSIAFVARAVIIDQGLFSLRMMPGESRTETVLITNTDTVPRRYRLVLRDFIATDETGVPQFISESEPRLASSLVDWISWPEDEISLVAGESREVPFTIIVPTEADFGGYYGALLFNSSLESQQGGVIESSIGSLIVLTVGEVQNADLELTAFKAEQKIWSHLPVSFLVRTKNVGSIPVAPTGRITITNLLGSSSTVLDVNPSGGNVLNAQTRQFETVWQRVEVTKDSMEIVKEWKNFGFGYYTAWLMLEDGSGEVTSARASFWVIPWQLISLAFLVFVMLLAMTRRKGETK
ncbi:MAG: DUF916 domain-containing protein [Patescibacteria group bacterium]